MSMFVIGSRGLTFSDSTDLWVSHILVLHSVLGHPSASYRRSVFSVNIDAGRGQAFLNG